MRILSRFGFLAPVIGVLLVASSPTAKAGLLNINLAQFHDTDTGYDGEGILGGGLWNRINFQDAAKANPLVKADGSYTRAYITETGLGNPAGATQDGNDLQDESWGNHQQENPADREIPVEVTVFRLIPGQVYKVAVYSDRIGSESEFPDTYTVNGVTKPLPNPGDGEDIPLPGVEGVDYALFIVDANDDGHIVISAPFIASIQVQGIIDDFESGPQVDCRIARSGSGSQDRGNDVYGFRIMRGQSLVQTTRGRRARRFHVGIENDGDVIDRAYATGNWAHGRAWIRILDRTTRENVTGAFRIANYRFLLGEDEIRRFVVTVKPKSPRPTMIYVPICGSPSTIRTDLLDCVTCKLKVK